MKRLYCLSVLLFALSSSAAVTQIVPADAYAFSAYSGRGPAKAINGSGLADGLHGNSAGDMWMGNGGNIVGGWFLVDFGSVQPLGSIKFWNYNQGGYVNRGLKDIEILVSTAADPRVNNAPDFTDTATWTSVQSHQIPQASGQSNYAGETPLMFHVPVEARWVGFRIESGWGGGYGGLSEVQFFTAADYIPTLLGLSNFAASSVTISGSLFSLDGTDGAVTALYGTSDGGLSAADWSSSASLGEIAPGAFTASLTGLAADTGYYVALSTGSGADEVVTVPAQSFMTGAITVVPPSAFYENDSLQKSVTFTRPAGCASVETVVFYSISGSAAADYASALTGSVTFPAGATSASVTFTPVNDSATTGDRAVTVTVEPGSYLLAASSSGTFTVKDDESATPTSYNWNGEGDGESWTDAANWTPTGVPMILDNATIDANCSEAAPIMASGDISVAKLNLATTANSIGALRVAGGVSGKDIIEIGGKGDGFLWVTGGAVSVPNGSLYLGRNAGASGTAVLSNDTVSVKSGKYIYVGDSGSGTLVVGGTTSIEIPGASSGHLYVGNVAGSHGEIIFNDGTISHGGNANIGNSGYGRVEFNGGTWSGYRAVQMGVSASGVGEFVVNGGHIGVSAGELVVGGNGTGTMVINAGSHSGRGVTIANGANSTGTLTVNDGASIDSGTTGYSFTVGKNGSGTLHLRGGTAHYSKNGKLQVRGAAAATGLIDGWGTIACSATGGTIENNGVVRADGQGEERVLALSSPATAFANTIENDDGTGWFAVDKGVLRLSNAATVAAGDSGEYVWGEAAADDELDIVNSVRMRFTSISAKLSNFVGELRAADHSSAPASSGGRLVVGVWNFTASGTFASVDLQFRVDPVAEGKNIRILHYNPERDVWERLETREVAPLLVEVAGETSLGLFAAIASERPTMLFFR